MKKIPEPTFFSQDLQKALAVARPIIEGVDEARDRVSNDVKALEAYLQAADFKVPFRHALGKSFNAGEADAATVAASLEYGGSASGLIQEEAIVWDQDTRGRFRLLYELSTWEGYLEIDTPGGPYFCDASTLQCDRRPLIETKFEIRKRLYPHLPEFVRGLAEHLAVDPPHLGELSIDARPF